MLQWRNGNRWLLVNIVGLLASGYLHDKSIVSDDLSDGFTVGIYYIATTWEQSGLPYLLGEQLSAVHLVRYLSVYPLYWLHENQSHHIFQYGLLAMFMLPLISIRFGGRRHIIQALFIYLPLFISFRAVLVVCSISYFFIILYSTRKSHLLFALSALFANLSSGAVMAWVVISLLNSRRLMVSYRMTYFVCLMAVSASLYASMSHKSIYFDEMRTLNTSRIQAMILQNTMLESYRNGQHARLAVYSVMLIAGLGIIGRSVVDKTVPRTFMMFYVVSIAGFLVEGLSVLGFVVPVFWYYIGVRPHWSKPRKVAQLRRADLTIPRWPASRCVSGIRYSTPRQGIVRRNVGTGLPPAA